MTGPLRARLRQAGQGMPNMSIAIAAGVAVAGVTTYVFLVLAARSLGADRYAPLAVLWAASILLGPGFFVPVEQELGRAIAARRARGVGARPLVAAGARVTLAGVVVVGAAVVALWPVVLGRLFDHQVVLLVALLLALAGSALAELMRGVFSGTGAFRRYAVVLGAEGVARMLGAALLWAVAVDRAGPFGLVLGAGSLVAVAIVLFRRQPFTEPGPPAPVAEMSAALGWLLAASLLSQFLVNAGPLAVKLLATRSQSAAASRFQTGLVLARVPLYFFQAVQAPLIPRLTHLATTGKHDEFRAGLVRLTLAILGLAAVMTVGAGLLGPAVLQRVFGRDFRLGGADLAVLAAAAGAFMLALTYASALLALSRHARVAAGWLAGTVVCLVCLVVLPGLIARVELSFLAGTAAAAGVLAALTVAAGEEAAGSKDDEAGVAPPVLEP